MKTLTDLLQEVRGGGINVQYSADSKLVPDGEGGYRKVRARRIKVGDKAPNPSEIDAPDVGDTNDQDKNRVVDLYKKYLTLYNRTLKPAAKKDTIQVKEETIEEANFHQEDFPYILVLKRLNVRQYPNNVKIGLYFNEKLQKHFSIPYGPSVDGEIRAEEVTVESQKSLLLNILDTFHKLNEDNQQKMVDLLKDPDFYEKIIKFSNERS